MNIPRIKKYIEIIKNADIELIKQLGFNDEELKKQIEKVEELIEEKIILEKRRRKTTTKEKQAIERKNKN